MSKKSSQNKLKAAWNIPICRKRIIGGLIVDVLLLCTLLAVVLAGELMSLEGSIGFGVIAVFWLKFTGIVLLVVQLWQSDRFVKKPEYQNTPKELTKLASRIAWGGFVLVALGVWTFFNWPWVAAMISYSIHGQM